MEEQTPNANTTQPPPSKSYLCNVLVLAISFQILYIAISVCSSLSSEVMVQLNYGKLGFLLVSLYHFTVCIGCFFVSRLINKFTARKVIPYGSLISISFIASYILPVACDELNASEGLCNQTFVTGILILASLIGGFGLAMVWVSEKVYIRECSTSVTVNRNQGMFFSIFALNVVIGNLLGMALLKNKEMRVGMYIIMAILGLVAMCIQFFLPKSGRSDSNDLPEEKDISINETFSFMCSKEFKPLIFPAMYHGCEVAYLFTTLPTLAGESVLRESGKTEWDNEDDEIDADKKTCIVMIGFGIGEILGALFIGNVATKIGRRKNLHITFLFSLLTLIVAFIVTSASRNDYNGWWFFMALMWGCMDTIVVVSNQSISVSEFPDPVKGTSTYDAVQTITTTLVILLAAAMSEIHPAWLLMVMLMVCIPSYLTMNCCFNFKPFGQTETPPALEQPEPQAEAPEIELPDIKMEYKGNSQ